MVLDNYEQYMTTNFIFFYFILFLNKIKYTKPVPTLDTKFPFINKVDPPTKTYFFY